MLKKLVFLCALVGLLAACNTKSAKMAGKSEPTIVTTADGQHFGEIITAKDAIPFGQLVEKLESTDSVETKVVATITDVCQMKGCWMNITADGREEKMFVKFKDYAFFVPKDSAGKEVVMQGKAYRETTSVEELRHYAEDAGKSEDEVNAITEPKTELKFMASGIILLDSDKK